MLINPIDLRLSQQDVEALLDAVMDQEIRWKTRLRLAREKYARAMTPLRLHEITIAENRLGQFEDIAAKINRALDQKKVLVPKNES